MEVYKCNKVNIYFTPSTEGEHKMVVTSTYGMVKVREEHEYDVIEVSSQKWL